MTMRRRFAPKGLLVLPALAIPALVFAAESGASAGLDWLEMGIELLGGLALFLFGMEQLADSAKAVAGERMRGILAKVTGNRVTAAVTGAFVTAVIQSSSVTTVLVVGFVSAGLMTVTQSIGIIMGANIGTTVTAQIVAFKVTEAALLLIAVGFGVSFGAKSDRLRHYGTMTMGLGLIFFGMGVMSGAMYPLRSYGPFLELMTQMRNPLVGIGVAALFTALIQSSSAMTGIVIVMASQGFVTLEAGIALAFGANIGTCVTAMLASLGKRREAVRAALIHILFNVVGVALWVAFIPQLADLAVLLSPGYPGLPEPQRLAAEAPRQIANANTLFNLLNTLLFLPMAGVFAKLAFLMAPDRPEAEALLVRPRFLDDTLMGTPALALDRVRLEVGHMGELVAEMLDASRTAILKRDRIMLNALVKQDDRVDQLHKQLLAFLGRLRKQPLSDHESEEFERMVTAISALEAIGDVFETDLVPLGRKIFAQRIDSSPKIQVLLDGYYELVRESLANAYLAVAGEDRTLAEKVLAMKPLIAQREEAILREQAAVFAQHIGPAEIDLFRHEAGLAGELRRIYTLAKRVAKTALPVVEEPQAGSKVRG